MTQPDIRASMYGSNLPTFGRYLRWAWLPCLLHLLACHGSVTVLPTSAGRLGTVRLFRSEHPSSGFVFLFSDATGWTPKLEEAGRQLAEHGAVVAGVDLPQYLRGLAASDDGCHYLISEIEDMSERLQRDLGFPRYRSPILVGIGEGGMLAYAALAQSPNVTVGGAISIEPVRALHTKVPLCEGAPATALPGGGFTYAGRSGLPGWWHVVVPNPEPSWLRTAMNVADAVQLPDDPTQSMSKRIVASVEPMLEAGGTAQSSRLSNLPLVEIEAEHPSDLMAVIYSGDGGWRDIDKQIGEVLAKEGVPVVGVDSLRYFWKEKTPEETALDLDAIVQSYTNEWKTPHVILVGYSFGAGILPFAINRLPPATRAHVVLTSLLGIESRADFEIALTGWLGAAPRKSAPPTLPEVLRLDLSHLQCFFGEEEEDTLCRNPQLAPCERIETKGGHHFDEDYTALAERILEGARQRLAEQKENSTTTETPTASTVSPTSPQSLIDLQSDEDVARIAPIDETCPYATRGKAGFSVVAQADPPSPGRVLRLEYSFAHSDPTPVGIHIPLSSLDASAYDHLEIRVRSPTAASNDLAPLRIGFRRPEPGGRGLVQTGSFVVREHGDQWRTISIPLSSMLGIDRWTDLSDFFIAVEPAPSASQTGVYLLDGFVLRHTGNPGERADDRPPMPLKHAWMNAAAGPDDARERKRQRLVGWPHRLLVPREELPRSDPAFLRRLAHDTWRGLDALRDREHALPLDTVSFRETASPEAARIGDYTNVTNVGLYLIATVAAQELDLIQRSEATEQIGSIVHTLEQLETHQGAFFNYYDTTTLERSTHFVSFVDAAWLTAGLMVVRSAFPELAPHVTPLIEQTNYGIFYDQARGLISHGLFVHLGLPSEYHYGLLYTEARLGSLIAIGKGDVPEEHWFRMLRIFPAACSWQRQTPQRIFRESVHRHSILEGEYHWEDVRYVPSWGGSMFEALMPTLVVDERRWAPDSLGRNDLAHAAVQRRWASAAGFPVWGLSPSRDPAGGYGEYGVPVLGSRGYDPGPVAPHAAALALAVIPAEAIANLRRMVELYDVYGDYGLYDSVDPKSGRVARDYLALDQAMILIALANDLKPHCIQETFASDPIAQRVLPLLQAERFFE